VTPSHFSVSAVVEGALDAAVAERLVLGAGGHLGPIFRTGGRSALLKRIGAYNSAAQFRPYLVLADLDEDQCGPSLRTSALAGPARFMCFRICGT
jgi:hypothetical protein